MNKMSREILQYVLQSERAWDKKTRKLNLDWVQSVYLNIREARFYDEVFFPRMARAFRMIKSWGLLPEEVFGTVDIGYEKEKGYLWVIDPELAEDIGDHFMSQYGINGRATYFQRIWDSEEWEIEYFIEEDILSLEIKPSVVPQKVYQDGSVQKSLF